MLLLQKFLQEFFHLLYHPFAWSYDIVSATVSLGRWNDWVLSLLPELHGPRILELGHGPGHLLESMHGIGLDAVGLDESWQMSRQAYGNLAKSQNRPKLVNGYAQHLPFPSSIFDQVVATFPSEYIIDPLTLASIFRVLIPGGELLILPVAWITGTRLPDRLARGLFRITGQAPAWDDRFLKPILKAGFAARVDTRQVESSTVLLIHANKP